jgi:hypothetical protein
MTRYAVLLTIAAALQTAAAPTDVPEQPDRKKPGYDDPRLTRGEKENYYRPGGIASQTDKEYWDRRARGLGGARLQTPDDLKAYDPALVALLARVYAGHHIPADVFYSRNISPRRR